MKKLIAIITLISSEALSETGCYAMQFSCDASFGIISASCTNLERKSKPKEKDIIPTSDGIIESNDLITDIVTISKDCEIKDSNYIVSVKPMPGNYNTQSRCGSWLSAIVIISRSGDELAKEFLGGTCDSWLSGNQMNVKTELKLRVKNDI